MPEGIEEKPNIVLIVSDSLRKENLQFYGYEEETAPFLGKMASEHTAVQNYNANAPWTIPAHASIFSGKLPSEHGTNSQNLFFEDRNRLVELLNQEGYRTGLFTENNLVTPTLGFGPGFDVFKDLSGRKGEVWSKVWKNDSDYSSRLKKWSSFLRLCIKREDYKSLQSLSWHILDKLGFGNGETYNPGFSNETKDKILDFMSEDQPFFIFANFTTTHYEYTFNEREKQYFIPEISPDRVRKLTRHGEFSDFLEHHESLSDSEIDIIEGAYNASIRYTDSIIEQIYEKSPENTIFLVIGDHGEVIGEYSFDSKPIVEHHFGTFEELIEVPLLAFPLNVSVEGMMSHKDLIEFIEGIKEGKNKFNFGDEAVSEYYSRRGFNDRFEIEIPEGFESLYSRESFKIKSEDSCLEFSSNSSVDNLSDKGDRSLAEKLPFVLKTVLKEKGFI